MPVYGAPAVYGAPLVYGFDADPSTTLAGWRNVYGGYAPWLPTNKAYWRRRCWSIGTTDVNHLFVDALTGLSTGSERHIMTQGIMLPQETLTLQLADPTGTYLEDGVDFDLLAPNSLMQLRAVVETPAGSLTWLGTGYRLLTGLSRTRDRWGRDVLTAQAEDWLRAPVAQPVSALPDWTILTPTGTPLVHAMVVSNILQSVDRTWLDVVRGVYSVLAGGDPWVAGTPPTRCSVLEGTHTGGEVIFNNETTYELNDDWLRGSLLEFTWAQTLESLQTRFGWRVEYDGEGYPRLSNADTRVDSSYTVSTSAALGGGFPVPWERYTRALGRAAYTRVEVWSDPPTTAPWLGPAQAGAAQSSNPLFPHEHPMWHVEYLKGADYGNIVATARLREHLSPADRLTLTVDSACPPPAVHHEVRVIVPEDDMTGWYGVEQVTQPLGVVPATWVLGWRAV